MKILFAAFITTILLAGCSTTKIPRETTDPIIASRVEYIVKIPPEELVKLPANVEPINVDTATQATVAQWIINSEDRTKELENIIIGIMKFLHDEQEALNEQAIKENEVEGTIIDTSKKN